MEQVHNVIDRARVLLQSVVAWLVVITLVVQDVTARVVTELSPDAAEAVTSWSGRILAVIGGIVLIVRRVVPLPKETDVRVAKVWSRVEDDDTAVVSFDFQTPGLLDPTRTAEREARS